MDNLTHSLVGVALAEAAIALRARRGPIDPALARATWITSIVANNAPDFDVVAGVLGPQPLSYLLFHRGHTHTLALAPIMAALSLALAYPVLRGVRREERPWGFLSVVAVLGVLAHIGFDLTNNYGVHPLWPIDERWLYGDTLFIIEPTLLAWGGALAVFAARHRAARVVLGLVPVIAIGASIFSGMVPPAVVAILGATTPLCVLVSRRASQRVRAGALALVTLGVPSVFFAAGVAAHEVATRALSRLSPPTEILDIALSPMPGNPLCWSATSAELDGDTLRERRFGVSIAGSLVPVVECHIPYVPGSVAPTRATQSSYTEEFVYFDELDLDLSSLARLASERCDVRAYLRFARMPFLTHDPDGASMGDLRYDHPDGHRFSRLTLGETPTCLDHDPGWRGPIDRLLRDRAAATTDDAATTAH